MQYIRISLFAILSLCISSAAAQEPAERDRIDQQKKELDGAYEQAKALMTIPPVSTEATDSELRRLLKERFNTAVEEMQTASAVYDGGRSNFESILKVGKRIVDAGLELVDDLKERIKLLSDGVALAKCHEANVELQFRANSGELHTVARAKYDRLDAEIQLLRAKRALESKPAK